MAIFITFIIFIAVIIFIFSSKKFSPIPYFPSQSVDLPKIVKALNLKNNQTVFDLGAGDGIIIFEAAKSSYQQKLNTKFIGVEINPVLILILHLRRFFHPNRKNIKIVYGDIFKMNFKSFLYRQGNASTDKALPCLYPYTTFYLYISPWFLEKTFSNIKTQFLKFKTVSYMYPIKLLKNKEKIIQGKNKIFVYN